MGKFSLFLWLFWVKNITLKSFLYGAVFAFVLTIFFYIFYGMPSLSEDILHALYEVFSWSFAFTWSISFLLFLFREFLSVFERCIVGYKLQVLDCQTKEPLVAIGYGDIVKIWRRWFFVLIWLVASCFILLSVFLYLLGSAQSFREIFSIYLLYVFVMFSGYISFLFLIYRCKKTKVQRC